jgi:hypothetical protein
MHADCVHLRVLVDELLGVVPACSFGGEGAHCGHGIPPIALLLASCNLACCCLPESASPRWHLWAVLAVLGERGVGGCPGTCQWRRC